MKRKFFIKQESYKFSGIQGTAFYFCNRENDEYIIECEKRRGKWLIWEMGDATPFYSEDELDLNIVETRIKQLIKFKEGLDVDIEFIGLNKIQSYVPKTVTNNNQPSITIKKEDKNEKEIIEGFIKINAQIYQFKSREELNELLK